MAEPLTPEEEAVWRANRADLDDHPYYREEARIWATLDAARGDNRHDCGAPMVRHTRSEAGSRCLIEGSHPRVECGLFQPELASCPVCRHPHLDYLADEACVSCGCEGPDAMPIPENEQRLLHGDK